MHYFQGSREHRPPPGGLRTAVRFHTFADILSLWLVVKTILLFKAQVKQRHKSYLQYHTLDTNERDMESGPSEALVSFRTFVRVPPRQRQYGIK